jgi:hypothetical protein
MIRTISRYLPALRVHTWGGFGSQLFTAHLILKIKERYPVRRIKIVLHTSGVTKRLPEIIFDSLGVRTHLIDDHKRNRGLQGAKDSPRSAGFNKSVRLKLLAMLEWSKLIQNANTDTSFESVRTWTLALRGHYTQLTLEKHLVGLLYEFLFSEFESHLYDKQGLAIHYRMGDLLVLHNKSPIAPSRVEGVVEKLEQASLLNSILLTDSSSKDAACFLEKSKTLMYFKVENHESRATLRICAEADIFIGTNAKISIWAAIFRTFVFNKDSFLPTELSWCKIPGEYLDFY